jgi:hypothetical protein
MVEASELTAELLIAAYRLKQQQKMANQLRFQDSDQELLLTPEE